MPRLFPTHPYTNIVCITFNFLFLVLLYIFLAASASRVIAESSGWARAIGCAEVSQRSRIRTGYSVFSRELREYIGKRAKSTSLRVHLRRAGCFCLALSWLGRLFNTAQEFSKSRSSTTIIGISIDKNIFNNNKRDETSQQRGRRYLLFEFDKFSLSDSCQSCWLSTEFMMTGGKRTRRWESRAWQGTSFITRRQLERRNSTLTRRWRCDDKFQLPSRVLVLTPTFKKKLSNVYKTFDHPYDKEKQTSLLYASGD